uniref:Glycosyl transferase family 2 n=1 Tax=Cyanothece sp. (strain PCC 7425 / ATCC 29141) TaxID=395961 RepID=B8HRA9_CYAP4
MSCQPLVSIIVIFFNAEQFIEEAIGSVLAQTYPHWELLLVDDGSSDGSTAIAQHYSARYPDRIRYLEHEGHQNRGKSTSRNLGIQHAQGDYLALLDADDIYLPQKLEHQVAILQAQPQVGMVYGPTLYWYGWTGKFLDQQRDRLARLGVKLNSLIQPPQLLTLYLTNSRVVPCTCGLLIRRQLAAELGGFEETIQHLYEDQTLIFKICLRSPVYVDENCWDQYRQHEGSSSFIAIRNGEYHPLKLNPARQAFLQWLGDYLTAQNCQDLSLWQAYRQAMWPYEHPRIAKPYLLVNYFLRQLYGILTVVLLGPMVGYGRSLMVNLSPSRFRAKIPASLSLIGWLKNFFLNLKGRPSVGSIDFGHLRQVTPISSDFGYDRGSPVDRYYIESFLERQSAAIKGRVLEIGDDSYTRQFGGDRVTTRDVLHVKEGNPSSTFVGDLTQADHIPSDVFDCLILTQTLHLIYDFRAALQTIYRILKPGGVALITVPGISQLSTDEWADYWCWAFTTKSCQLLFQEFFPTSHVQVEAFGNVLASIAFLEGIAAEELTRAELDHCDPCYQLLITIRAQKPEVRA